MKNSNRYSKESKCPDLDFISLSFSLFLTIPGIGTFEVEGSRSGGDLLTSGGTDSVQTGSGFFQVPSQEFATNVTMNIRNRSGDSINLSGANSNAASLTIYRIDRNEDPTIRGNFIAYTSQTVENEENIRFNQVISETSLQTRVNDGSPRIDVIPLGNPGIYYYIYELTVTSP
ncbi:hypothetical protein [Bacillus sp. 2205SS5-2]|uniref:hypothetical protein n=1 Tax=Bacillus sp. 2205SS5-2 TaxID=3109031 RepID=UPI003005131C